MNDVIDVRAGGENLLDGLCRVGERGSIINATASRLGLSIWPKGMEDYVCSSDTLTIVGGKVDEVDGDDDVALGVTAVGPNLRIGWVRHSLTMSAVRQHVRETVPRSRIGRNKRVKYSRQEIRRMKIRAGPIISEKEEGGSFRKAILPC